MTKGTIKTLMNRGYGFIKGEEEGDLFFHHSETEGVEFSSLTEGHEVEFEMRKDSKDRPQAVKVRLVETQVDDDGGNGGDSGGDGGG